MRKITFALLLSLFSTILCAQDFRFGVIAGPSLSTARMSDHEGFTQPKHVWGMQVGAFGELPYNDKISLRGELKYLTIGYKYAPDEEDTGFRLKAAYITLPITAQYRLTNAIKIGVGPYISLKTVAKYKLIEPIGDAYEYFEEDYSYSDVDSEEFSSIDFGLGGALNYQISSKVGTNLYYGHGMSNIFKGDNTDGGYNRYFSLGLSYLIR